MNNTNNKWEDVPNNLQEALELLDKDVLEDVKQEIRDYTPITQNSHFMCCIIGGMGMRNAWGLWHDSPLASWFRERGIWHADDMSAIIGTAFYHRLVGDKTIDDEWLAKERAFYDDYWAKAGATPETTEEMLARQ